MTDTDRDLLKQYDALRKEQEYLRRQLRRIRSDLAALKDMIVVDTVTGSREDLTIGPIKVSGPPTMAYRAAKRRLRSQQKRYQLSLNKADGLLQEIEKGIEEIPDARIRMILRLRYSDGKDWGSISRYFGNTKEWSRNQVDRFFSKNS